ncbi:hypothetical protein MTY_0401 [Moorella thermoacetica Y72]|uniref:Uncharacterized protein n=1 Tax=Moorella thermoacetica Y72 TaxID=1325331 RepID=A0A0S6UCJ3_NEOTH|nr:hypothetical protein MTY_0401 [Moorella thermoacetica Y72]
MDELKLPVILMLLRLDGRIEKVRFKITGGLP